MSRSEGLTALEVKQRLESLFANKREFEMSYGRLKAVRYTYGTIKEENHHQPS